MRRLRPMPRRLLSRSRKTGNRPPFRPVHRWRGLTVSPVTARRPRRKRCCYRASRCRSMRPDRRSVRERRLRMLRDRRPRPTRSSHAGGVVPRWHRREGRAHLGRSIPDAWDPEAARRVEGVPIRVDRRAGPAVLSSRLRLRWIHVFVLATPMVAPRSRPDAIIHVVNAPAIRDRFRTRLHECPARSESPAAERSRLPPARTHQFLNPPTGTDYGECEPVPNFAPGTFFLDSTGFMPLYPRRYSGRRSLALPWTWVASFNSLVMTYPASEPPPPRETLGHHPQE